MDEFPIGLFTLGGLVGIATTALIGVNTLIAILFCFSITLLTMFLWYIANRGEK